MISRHNKGTVLHFHLLNLSTSPPISALKLSELKLILELVYNTPWYQHW